MNYQFIGRPLVAPGLMPVVAGVPSAASVMPSPPGSMRSMIGQSLAAPPRMTIAGLPGMSMAAGVVPGIHPRALYGQAPLGLAGIPRFLPGQIPGQFPGQIPYQFPGQFPGQLPGLIKQEDEVKQEDEEAQFAVFSQAAPVSAAQFGLASQAGQSAHSQLLQSRAGVLPPFLQQSAAAAQLQFLQQNAGGLIQSPPPSLGGTPHLPGMSLSQSSVPVSSIPASTIHSSFMGMSAPPMMSGLMSSLAMSMPMSVSMSVPLMSQSQLAGLLPQAYGGIPAQSFMAYHPGLGGMSNVIDPSMVLKNEALEEDLGEPTMLDKFNCDLHLSIDETGYIGEPRTDPMGFCFCWAGVRATYGALSGKVCFEVYITENLPVDFGEEHTEKDPHIVRLGWSVDSHNFQLGEVKDSYGYGGTGVFSHNMRFSRYGQKFGKGDVIMCLLDLDQLEPVISYCKNGTPLGVAARVKNFQQAPNKALFPHILSKNCKFEVNFGQREAWFPPPPGGYQFMDQAPVHTKVRGMLPPSDVSQCEIIMVVGLPGSGKSTWAAKMQTEQFDKRYNIIGTDTLIDKMRVNGLPRKNNYHGRWDVLISKATNCLNKLFQIASTQPRNYILDQTNVYATARKRKLRNFQGFKRIVAVLQPDDEELKRREYKRTYEDGKFVPDDAVKEMKANYVLPNENEPFIDDIMWIELPREQCVPLVQRYNDECKSYKRVNSRDDSQKRHANDYGQAYGQPAEKKVKGGGGGGGGSALDFIKQEYDESQHSNDQYNQQGWNKRRSGETGYGYQQGALGYQSGKQSGAVGGDSWTQGGGQQQYNTWQQQQQSQQGQQTGPEGQSGRQDGRSGSRDRSGDRSDWSDRDRTYDRERERTSDRGDGRGGSDRRSDRDNDRRRDDDRRERDYYGSASRDRERERDRPYSRDRNSERSADRSSDRAYDSRYDSRSSREDRGRDARHGSEACNNHADEKQDPYYRANEQDRHIQSWQQHQAAQYADDDQNSQGDDQPDLGQDALARLYGAYETEEAGASESDTTMSAAGLLGAGVGGVTLPPELAHLAGASQAQQLLAASPYGSVAAGMPFGAAGLQALHAGLRPAIPGAGLAGIGLHGLTGATPGGIAGFPPGLMSLNPRAGLPQGLPQGLPPHLACLVSTPGALPPGLQASLAGGLPPGVQPGFMGAGGLGAGLPPGVMNPALFGLQAQAALTAGGQQILMPGLMRPQLLAGAPLAAVPSSTLASAFLSNPALVSHSGSVFAADLAVSQAADAALKAQVSAAAQSLQDQWQQRPGSSHDDRSSRSPYGGAKNDGRPRSRDSYNGRSSSYERPDSRRSDRSIENDRKERRSRWEVPSGGRSGADRHDSPHRKAEVNLSQPPPPPNTGGLTPNTGPGLLGEAPSHLNTYSKQQQEEEEIEDQRPNQHNSHGEAPKEAPKGSLDNTPGILGTPPPPPPSGDGVGGGPPRGGMRGRGSFDRGGFRGGFRGGRGGFDGPPPMGYRVPPPPRSGFRGPPPPMGGPPPPGGFRGRFGGPPRLPPPPGGFRGGFRGPPPRGPPPPRF